MDQSLNERLRRIAAFRLDVHAADLVARLERDGMRPVILKGPSFADCFYGPDEGRPYTDVDVLVRPEETSRAGACLIELGYRRHLGVEDDPAQVASHAEAWFNADTEVWIDLHTSLPGLADAPSEAWAALEPHRAPLHAGGRTVTALDRAANALVAALHAAHHLDAPSLNSEEDLRRALLTVTSDEWRSAKLLAADFGCLTDLAVGLHTQSDGARVADDLSLNWGEDEQRQVAWGHATREAVVLETLRGARPAARLSLIARTLIPTKASLRSSSRLAGYGPAGLALAYALRPVTLLGRLPDAVKSYRTARRQAAR